MSTYLLPDLAGPLPSWQLALRAEQKSPATIKSYTEGVAMFLRWCDSNGTPAELTKATVQTFVAELLESGQQPKTAIACPVCGPNGTYRHGWVELPPEVGGDLIGRVVLDLDFLAKPEAAVLGRVRRGPGQLSCASRVSNARAAQHVLNRLQQPVQPRRGTPSPGSRRGLSQSCSPTH